MSLAVWDGGLRDLTISASSIGKAFEALRQGRFSVSLSLSLSEGVCAENTTMYLSEERTLIVSSNFQQKKHTYTRNTMTQPAPQVIKTSENYLWLSVSPRPSPSVGVRGRLNRRHPCWPSIRKDCPSSELSIRSRCFSGGATPTNNRRHLCRTLMGTS